MEENLEIVRRVGHTRFPLCEGDLDHVIGLVHIKDLFRATEPPKSLTEVRRAISFIPETLPADRMLRRMRAERVHMAAVLDEYGGVNGIVTLENVIEEIVGEIQDEYDVEEPMVERLSDHEARIDGRADVDELLELFDLDLKLEDAEEYDTVGGLMYHRIGGVPSPGDTVEVDGLRLKVETTDGRRVGKVLVTRRVERSALEEGGPPDGDDGTDRNPRSTRARTAGTRTKR